MKVKQRKKVEQVIEHEVPSYFDFDPSVRGKVVDILIAGETSSGRSVRDRIHDEDGGVGYCVEVLTRAYEQADKIEEIYKGHYSV